MAGHRSKKLKVLYLFLSPRQTQLIKPLHMLLLYPGLPILTLCHRQSPLLPSKLNLEISIPTLSSLSPKPFPSTNANQMLLIGSLTTCSYKLLL